MIYKCSCYLLYFMCFSLSLAYTIMMKVSPSWPSSEDRYIPREIMLRRTKGINHLTFFCVVLFLIHSIWEQVPNRCHQWGPPSAVATHGSKKLWTQTNIMDLKIYRFWRKKVYLSTFRSPSSSSPFVIGIEEHLVIATWEHYRARRRMCTIWSRSTIWWRSTKWGRERRRSTIRSM